MNKDYRGFVDRLTPAELDYLQTYAKNRVLEPFEGQAGLDTLQETNRKLTSGINKLKEWHRSKIKKKESYPFKEQFKASPVASIFDKLGKLASDVSNLTKAKFKDIEAVVKELMFDFLKKGLELTRNEDYEQWILQSATKELNQPLTDLKQIRNLSDEDRELLIESLYPYRSKRYRLLLSSFDKSVSVFLGAVVATNLPGTGILVSLVNMVKTIIRMSNRINSLSVIYGFKVDNLSGLFEVCALLLKSIEDWDKNACHLPLEPQRIERLYQPPHGDFEKELAEFIDAVGTKEFYIAVPGIGMLSLGKINLDNLKIDLLIENVIQDYFLFKKIEASAQKDFYNDIINDFKLIYQDLKRSDYFKVLRNKQRLGQKPNPPKTISRFFKSMVGSESELDSLSANLTTDARIVFNSVMTLEKEKKAIAIRQAVKRLLDG